MSDSYVSKEQAAENLALQQSNTTKAQKLALIKLKKKIDVLSWKVVGAEIHVEVDDPIEPQVAITPNGLVTPR